VVPARLPTGDAENRSDSPLAFGGFSGGSPAIPPGKNPGDGSGLGPRATSAQEAASETARRKQEPKASRIRRVKRVRAGVWGERVTHLILSRRVEPQAAIARGGESTGHLEQEAGESTRQQEHRAVKAQGGESTGQREPRQLKHKSARAGAMWVLYFFARTGPGGARSSCTLPCPPFSPRPSCPLLEGALAPDGKLRWRLPPLPGPRQRPRRRPC